LLNKERVQGMTVTTPIQATETKLEVDKDWEVMAQRGAKKQAEGNIKLRKKGLLNFRGQAIVTANHYATLEADSHLLQNEDGLETIHEKPICTIRKNQAEEMKHIVQNYSITSASQEKLDLESNVEHNLQKHSLTHQLSNTKKRDLQHTNHNKWAIIKRGCKLHYTAKDNTPGEKESEYYEGNCKIGVQKAQNTRNW